MKANETTLKSLLQGEKQYAIPLYQRPYSWQEAHLRQLWNDLLRVAHASVEQTHFLGSVALAPSPANTPSDVQRWLVVDGQQRLTTLSILLCAIRDHVREADPQAAERIDDLYLKNKYASGLARYTLLPTQADRAYWISLIERTPTTAADDRINKAYHFFRTALQEEDDPEDPYDISRIEQAISARLSIVEIAAHADDNVYRIFESLNHTGLLLTQADLLRNYLFMRLTDRADEVYRFQWLPLQKMLTEKQLEQLVWLDLILRGNDRATQEAIYHLQQQRLNKLSEPEIEKWIVDLHDKARLFRQIVEPGSAQEPALRSALDRLDRWGANVVHPIALHVLVAHAAGRLSPAEAAASLRVVESYLVRRMLVGIASTGSNRILMSLVKELGTSTPNAAAITRVLSGPRRRFPTDQLVRESVLTNPFYWTGRGPQRSYILRCIEEDYRHGEPIDFDQAKLTIEHVLPQSPTAEWLAMLETECEADENPEDLHRSLVHTLGNLSLTAYNSKLANDGFEAKKKILADSGLAMNREIAATTRWGRQEIHQRGRQLTARIIAIWPGPDESVVQLPVTPRWAVMTQVLASIPAGRWTSYSDVAEVIGSFHRAVAGRLTSATAPNAHRVLKVNGEISSDFRWPDPERKEDPRAILEAEGVRFDEWGRASAEQRVTATELADAIAHDLD